jgi:DNA repair protein RadA/Sms
MGFLGRCPECGAWNSMLEEKIEEEKAKSKVEVINPAQLLDEVSSDVKERSSTGVGEFDLVLGGGVVSGSVILVGGRPGIGKSTLMLQTAYNLSKNGNRVLYISGEESLSQIKMRAQRLGIKNVAELYLMSETDITRIIAECENIKPAFLIIDSIQVVYHPELSSSPGTISQVKECAQELTRLAKQNFISTFLIGHVTKEGNLAGPMVLEHIVDAVLYFEGESFLAHRILRAIKNRFGSTNEIGLFEMTESGLKEVKNPSSIFLLEEEEAVPGNVIVPTLEGTRPILIQVQALVAKSYLGFPSRKAVGLDHNRVSLLTAVLERRAGLSLYDQDIYVNVVGGLKINEPAVDLGVVSALVSSFYNRPLEQDMVIFGEVGLGGEVRKVSFAEKRIKEAIKLGFKTAVVPKGNLLDKKEFNIKIIEISDIKQLIRMVQ